MLKKIVILISIIFALLACSKKESTGTLRVGTIDGPETQLMEVAKQVAAKRYGLNIKIITFSDYDIPNVALNDGSIDVNAFQHQPYLQAQIKSRGYKIIPVAKTFLYPMGLYSSKIKNMNELANGSKVAVPNDPSNEARALLLLQKAGLIKLKENADINATILNIAQNPKNLKFVELDAAELPRALNDVALAAINTNFALPANLSPKDALFLEDRNSPYVNLFVVRANDANNPKIAQLIKAYQSPEVIQEAKQLFGDGAIAGWVY